MEKYFKLLILPILLSITLASCQNKMKEKQYNWTAAACTPRNYPAEIFSGHLLLSEKPNSGYVYMPFDVVLNSEHLGENRDSGDKAIGITPKMLDITWMSYTENKSYSGIFKLDWEKIESLMINGSDRPYWDKKRKVFRFLKINFL